MIIGNKASVELFDLKDEKEYLDKFFHLSSAYQSDGEKSRKKAIKMVLYAFEKDYVRFDWLHRKLNGEKLPYEITLVKTVLYGEEVYCIVFKRFKIAVTGGDRKVC